MPGLQGLGEDIQGARKSDVRPGDTLGRYQLLLPIAAGGMGKVWAARLLTQSGLGDAIGIRKLVAVKTTLPEFANEAKFEKLFLDEARIASSIQHPNVCAIHELGQEGGILYLAMEWVDGGALSNVLAGLAEPRRIDPRIAARIVADACAGLHAAHELCDEDGELLNVVHRDISPHNILISSNGHVKVADFGVVKARGQLHQKTETGEFKGKISYMAPETFTTKSFDRRADIFALGCVLYQITVGDRPFRGEEMLTTMYQIIEGNPDKPSWICPKYPPELEAIVMKALHRDADKRYSTAEEMRLALEQWLASSGPVVTEADIASVVKLSLGDVIRDRRRSIRDAADSLGRGELPPSASFVRPSVSSELEITRSDVSSNIQRPSLRSGSLSQLQSAVFSDAPRFEVGSRPSSSGPLLGVALGFVIVAAAGLGFFVASRSSVANGQASVALAPPVVASEPPAPKDPSVATDRGESATAAADATASADSKASERDRLAKEGQPSGKRKPRNAATEPSAVRGESRPSAKASAANGGAQSAPAAGDDDGLSTRK